MFGFGSNRRQVRGGTFGSNKIRNAAMAGIGMLAWRWWRNRQSGQPTRSDTAYSDRPFSERRGSDSM